MAILEVSCLKVTVCCLPVTVQNRKRAGGGCLQCYFNINTRTLEEYITCSLVGCDVVLVAHLSNLDKDSLDTAMSTRVWNDLR